MKTTFLPPTRRHIFLVFSRFSGLTELGQAIGQPARQLPVSPGYQAGQGTWPGNQRFTQAQ